MKELELTVKGELYALHLQPGDILICRITNPPTRTEDYEYVRKQLRVWAQENGIKNPILVISPQIQFGSEHPI